MTDAERQAAIADHVQWCEKQKRISEEQIEFFTTRNGKIQVSHDGGELKDVTEETIADHRRVIADMDHIIAAYGRFNA